ncbi:MAG: hypothetical protein ACYDBV_14810, partial [Nitrospiria bacterium]
YRKLDKGEFIVVGGDTAAGGSDYCVSQFLSKTRLDVPLIYHKRTLATDMTNEIFPVLERIFDQTGVKPLVAYERNNGGLFEMERLAALNRNGKFDIFRMPTYGNTTNEISQKLGFDTNTATRPKMLSDLKEAVDKRLITIYDKATIEELYSFIVVQTSTSWKAQAESGAHDDLVMSLAIAWQLQQQAIAPTIKQTGGIPYNDPDRKWGVYGIDPYK